jgi:hypothetical protein
MTTGKQRGRFTVSCSNGSKLKGQSPSLRIRLAEGNVTIALLRTPRCNLLAYCRNNPFCPERLELERMLYAANVTHEEIMIILSV